LQRFVCQGNIDKITALNLFYVQMMTIRNQHLKTYSLIWLESPRSCSNSKTTWENRR